jgi:putative aldouronate transport system substrate-binding protein
MMMQKRILLVCLALAAAAAAFAGGDNQSDQGGNSTVRLSAWTVFDPPAVEGNITSYKDQAMWKYLEEKQGIHIEWTTVPIADWSTQISLVMASGSLPDYFDRINPQLAEQYGRQGALISLTKLIDTQVPNLKKLMDDNKAVRGQVTSPDGSIFFFPRLLLDSRTQHYAGLMIRGDWVKSLGFQMPQTTDDFYKVLKAIKEADFNQNKNTNEPPFIGDYRFLIWAFGAGSRMQGHNDDCFIENDEIKYGPADPRYRTAVEYLRKMHADGLIREGNVQANIVSEASASTYGSWAGILTSYNKLLAAERKNPGLMGLAPLQGPTGERNALSHHTEIDLSCGAAISSTTKKAGEIAKLYNFLYSKEGQMLVDFGIEGDTYNIVNGFPVYSDKVLKHPKYSVLTYMNAYNAYSSCIATVLIPEAYLATLSPEGVEGNRITAEADAKLNKKVPSLRFTDAETKEIQGLSRDLNTYVDENLYKFVYGQKPFSEWNSFHQGLQQLKFTRLLEIYNTAYRRYKAILAS